MGEGGQSPVYKMFFFRYELPAINRWKHFLASYVTPKKRLKTNLVQTVESLQGFVWKKLPERPHVGKLTRETSCGQIFLTTAKDSPLFVQL